MRDDWRTVKRAVTAMEYHGVAAPQVPEVDASISYSICYS